MGSIIADVCYLSIITGSIIADVRYLSIITGSIIADVRYLSIITGSKGPKGAFWAKMGPFKTPRGPEGARYQVKVCGDLTSIELVRWPTDLDRARRRTNRGAVGTKLGPSGPSEDLQRPQKGHFGQKRALLGPPGAQKGPDIRSKCVVI